MAELYRFFNHIDGDRQYQADEFAEYFRQVLTSGILNGGTNLQVTCDGTDRKSHINAGRAWIEGYFYKNTDDLLELTHADAHGTYDRIDRIVLRLDKNPENRYIKAFIKAGIPDVDPVAPELTRTDTTYEISLARVLIIHNTSVIASDKVTDERLDSNVCGLVNSLIQVDTAAMQEQFDAFMETLEGQGYASQTDLDTVSTTLAAIAKYSTATISSREIQITTAFTFTNNQRVIVEIPSNITEGDALTVKINSDTALNLKDEDNVDITSLDAGYYEFIARTGTPNFFVLAPKGTGIRAIQGAYVDTDINLMADGKPVKTGNYVYCNEATKLLYPNPAYPDEETFDRTTPVQVVNAAYDTSGNGGRKLVKLDNGVLICVLKNSPNYYLYKSVDNGQTWTQIYTNSLPSSITDISIATDGTIIYSIISYNSSSVIHYRFNEGGANLGGIMFDSSQTAIGNCSLTIDSNGHLHAAWASKNATYPNSFNIRYSKSIDGGVTWSSVEQLTTDNTSGIDNKNPCTVIMGNGYSAIVWERPATSNFYSIRIRYYNGSSWTSKIVYEVQNYTQSNPSAVVDGNGHIHVVWHGMDSTDNAQDNIRYSKSTDNSITWSAMQKMTSGNVYFQRGASISVNEDNHLFVTWHGKTATTTYNQIRLIKDIGMGWTAPVEITNSLSNTSWHPSTCDNYKDFEIPLTIYLEANTAVKFYGKWTAAEPEFLEQTIPSTSDASSDTELQADGTGTLYNSGNQLKKYIGFVSKKAVGVI